MGKSLKKLSRVELLELLVNLSQDYEDLADENNRLKQMLAAQRLPRSTKVGSIAEAALQANRYFEAAQRSADDYLREIKHLRDELARRVESQDQATASVRAAAAEHAGRQAQLELQQAQAQARQIVAHANTQARSILADARSRAEETLANANRQSHELLSRSQRQAAASGAVGADATAPVGRANAAGAAFAADGGDVARRSIRSVPSPLQSAAHASATAGDFAGGLPSGRSHSGRIAVEGRP